MRLPDAEWPDPYGRARSLVNLNKTVYGIKQVNREYYEEVIEFRLDDLSLQASIAAPGLVFGGNLGQANCVLIPVHVDNMMIIGTLVVVASIASRLYDRSKAAGHVPVQQTLQNLTMIFTRDHSKRSTAIDHISFINRLLDLFEITECRKRSTPMAIGYKPHVTQPELGEHPLPARTYQEAIHSVFNAALGTRPDITHATSVLGRYTTQPSTLHWEAVKHQVRYLRATANNKVKIYDPSLGHDSQSILCYADADLGGETDTSKSTSGIVVYVLGTLIIWQSKKQCVVAQLTMHEKMIATAHGKVEIDSLCDLTSEIRIANKDITRRILNDGLNCVMTFNSGNFQSDSRHLRLQYDSIHEGIVKGEIEIKHVAGTEMLADALTQALRGVELRELVEEIRLG